VTVTNYVLIAGADPLRGLELLDGLGATS